MTFSGFSIEIADGIARMILNDPDRGNPIDGPFCSSLCEAAIQISENEAVRCLLISAEGKAFSFGGDIESFVHDLDSLPSNIKRWTATLNSAIIRLQRMSAPIVSAVQGVCAGGMSGFIAGSDIVIAAENARFVAAYAGIGFCCDAGTSAMYSRRMGLARARKFLLLNETLTASQALSAGLVDEVVPLDLLLARANEVAMHFSRGPRLALEAIRQLLLSANTESLEAQLELEAQALARIVGSKDAREGLLAFAEKRAPTFRGE